MSDQRPPVLSEEDAAAFPGTPRPGLTEADYRKPIPEWGADEERQQLIIGLLAAAFLFLLFGGGLALLGFGDEADELAEIVEAETDFENDAPLVAAAGDLEADVEARLEEDALGDGVGVAETEEGVISLAGEVPTEDFKTQVAAAAAGVAGVDRVINGLTVAEGDTTPVAPTDDLLSRVQAAEDEAGFGDITVTEPEAGMITLTGEVPTEADKSEAETVARGVDGVEEVDNQLTVPAATDLVGDVRAAEDEAGFEEIDVEVDGTSAILTGEVPTDADKTRAGEVAAAVEGITAVENNLTIAAIPDSSLEVDVQGTTIVANGELLDQSMAETVDDVIGNLGGTGELNFDRSGPDGTVVVTGMADNQEQRDQYATELSGLADTLGFEYDDTGYVLGENAEANSELEQQLNDLVNLEPVNFDVASANITGGESTVLDQAAEVLLGSDSGSVTIEGHTDSDGEEAANQALSEARAESVKNYLVGQGVDAARLNSVGFGETQPIGPNETPEGKAANRRVVFKVAG